MCSGGAAGHLFEAGIEAPLFAAELLLGVLLPIILFASDRVRNHRSGLFIAATFVVVGFVLGRLNVGITAFEASSDGSYFPSFLEISITLMLVVVGFIAFGQAVKHLPVFGPKKH